VYVKLNDNKFRDVIRQ